MNRPNFISSIKKCVPGLDVAYAIDAMGGSESLYEKMLMRMARQIPLHVEEMDESLDSNGDLGVFAVTVHGLKSTLRQVGKMTLADEAESLEAAAKSGNKTYCDGHYIGFRDELLRFFNQVNEAAGPDAEPESANNGNISDFAGVIKQAEEAANLCDSMTAYEILLPLTKVRFGGNTDDLVSKAVTALDQFKPFEALEYISDLMN